MYVYFHVYNLIKLNTLKNTLKSISGHPSCNKAVKKKKSSDSLIRVLYLLLIYNVPSKKPDIQKMLTVKFVIEMNTN